MGMRWQFDGRATSAISGFADLPVALRAAGLRRSAASALIGIGADYAITPLLTLFLAGHGQLADGTHSTRLQGGVSARF
jgi:HEAT repeat protein